jgi:beta-lactamase superfamily II metal-dependent hydrolase
MLRITVLNVGHGDSIIIEHEHEGVSHFGVIDSNFQRAKQAKPRALEYLEKRGVTRIAFLALTHPHYDHVKGLGDLAQHFSGNIDYVLMYPIPRDVDRFKKLTAQEFVNVEEPHRSFIGQLLKLINEAEKTTFEILDGLENKIALNNFTLGQLEMHVIMPPAASKGWLHFDVKEGRIDFGGEKQNEISLALAIKYRGKTIVLGGDATEENWVTRARRVGQPIGCVAAKLPHHGSEHDCSPRVLDHIFGNNVVDADERIALISANGTSHPSPNVLRELKKRGISPYCTSRAKICGGGSITQLVTDNALDPQLLRDVNSYAKAPVIEGACQGDITIEFDNNGVMNVVTQYATPCGFRKHNSFGI